MSTSENLQEAFAGESQANRKYLAFAKRAEQDGYPQVARLFRAAAEAETIHAHTHLRVMGGIKKTDENLQAAIEGESFEVAEMYPAYIKVAEDQGEKTALMWFNAAMVAEKVHAGLYEKAKESVDRGKDLDYFPVQVCGVCGFTAEGEAPDKCPVCGAPKEKFVKF